MSLFHRRCCLLGFVLAPSLAATSLSGQDRPLDAVAAAMEPTRTVVYFIFDLELFAEAMRQTEEFLERHGVLPFRGQAPWQTGNGTLHSKP